MEQDQVLATQYKKAAGFDEGRKVERVDTRSKGQWSGIGSVEEDQQ